MRELYLNTKQKENDLNEEEKREIENIKDTREHLQMDKNNYSLYSVDI